MMEKNKRYVTVLFTFLVALVVSCKPNEKHIQLINTLDFKRTDAPVVLKRNDIGDIIYPLVRNEKGEAIPYQLDDLDNDGEWDELFLLIDMDANDTLELSIVASEEIMKFEPRVHIQFAAKDGIEFNADTVKRLSTGDTQITSQHFQMEGPAWENENVGFRNYYDARNGMDIFGKQVSDIVLKNAGVKGQNYHAIDDWGMDILKVGNSLGAGAIALSKDDTIYRWDGTGDAGYELLYDGPLRSSFELFFKDWKVDDVTIDLKHQITIHAGTNYYHSMVKLSDYESQIQLVTGIVNLHSDTLYLSNSDGFVTMYTHDRQAENQSYLGMGILAADSVFSASGEAPQEGGPVTTTYLGTLKFRFDNTADFYYYAGWQNQDSRFENREFFNSSIEKAIKELSHPIIVKY
ncbi:MAG: DUF4861 family protein [Bacteroidota bacterium]